MVDCFDCIFNKTREKVLQQLIEEKNKNLRELPQPEPVIIYLRAVPESRMTSCTLWLTSSGHKNTSIICACVGSLGNNSGSMSPFCHSWPC